MLGQNHFSGENSWNVEEVPDNLRLLGHITGKDKLESLSSAWILVNTPIHEESPVSVLEALAYETPVISFEDQGRLIDRHGIARGQRSGTGIDGLPEPEDALTLLLSDDDLRKNYGRAGRKYVENEHNDELFLSSFREIFLASGVSKATKSININNS